MGNSQTRSAATGKRPCSDLVNRAPLQLQSEANQGRHDLTVRLHAQPRLACGTFP